MAKLGLLFSGQGAQYKGMGLDFPKSNDYLELVEKLTSINLKAVIATGENLNETRHTQLAVLIHSCLAFEMFKTLDPMYAGIAGFSLGEYSALTAANVLSLETSIKLVYNRSLYMNEAASVDEGVMAAVLGLDKDAVIATLKKVTAGIMVPANFNSPFQTVISGQKKALEETTSLLKESGAKRVLPLQVSGAFHSPLMIKAGSNLATYLEDIAINEQEVDVYMNVTGEKLDIKTLKTLMIRQVSSPVLFTKTIENMQKDGFTHLLELGPGSVLSNLVKKCTDQIEVFNFDANASFETLKGWLNTHGFIK